MSKAKLTRYLGSLHPVSKGLKALLENNHTLTKRLVNKGATLLMPRMHTDESHYIFIGSCKVFWLNEDNEEEIFSFFVEDEIVFLPEEFFEGKDNMAVYIVMLEDSELYTITKDKLDKIYAQYPEAMIMTHKIRSRIMEKRNLHLRLLMKRERVRYGLFYEQFPEVRNRLTDKDICSFLRISRATLALGKTDLLFKNKRR